jgi:hypothetical protein
LLTSIFALKRNIGILQKIAIVGVVSVVFNITAVVIISLVGFNRDSVLVPGTKIHYNGIFKFS